ncbi:hypothetical protein D3C76_450920 [compost metagenome]
MRRNRLLLRLLGLLHRGLELGDQRLVLLLLSGRQIRLLRVLLEVVDRSVEGGVLIGLWRRLRLLGILGATLHHRDRRLVQRHQLLAVLGLALP